MRRTRKPKEYPTESIEWGKSVTDDKFYTPTSEAIRNLILSGDSAGGQDVYDFKDGKDDGRAMPIWRQQGVDRAEISQEMLKQKQEIEEIQENEKTNARLSEKRAKEKIEKIQDQTTAMKNAIEATKSEPKA